MPRKVNYGVDYDEDYDDYRHYDYDEAYDFDDEDNSASKSEEESKTHGIWRCSICTYDNDESLFTCDICGVLRNPLITRVGMSDKKPVEGIGKESSVSIMAKSLFASSLHRMPKKAVLVKQLNILLEYGNTGGNFHDFHKAFSSCGHYHIKIDPFKFDAPSPDDLVSNGLLASKKGSKAILTDIKPPNISLGGTKKNGAINDPSTVEWSERSSALMPKGRQDNSKNESFFKKEACGKQLSSKSSDSSSASMLKGKQVNVDQIDFSKNVTSNIKSRDKGADDLPALMPKHRDEVVDESNTSSGQWDKPQNLTSSLNSMALDVKSAYSNYVISKGENSETQYKPEKWMLLDQAGDCLTQLNLAIVGHVDSGKSTLSGRLLHLLGQVSKKEMHKNEKEAKLQGKGSFAYAWALDESAEERERGITMTVGVAYFDSKRYHVVILDSPGHKDFIPNMISGATQADAAVIVIDASVGSFEAGMDSSKGQTREHAQLIRSFGVDQIIVAVNKMDVVDFSKDRYDFIKQQLGTFLRTCGFKDSSVCWIPLSAMGNQNLTMAPSDDRLLSWYHGPNLLEGIDSHQPPTRDFSKPLLMPICDVIKSLSMGQVSASGKLEAGALRIGSKVIVMPSGSTGTVRSLERDSRTCSIARAGDNVAVSLQGIDGGNVMAGGVLCHPNFPVAVSKHVELKILVLDLATPILIGSQLEVHIHHVKEAARVVRILSLLDPKTGKVTKKAPRCLTAKQNAVIEVCLLSPVCVETFSTSRALGRVFLRALGRTVAVGIVTRIIEDQE